MPHLHLSTSANLVENVDVPDILAALARELSMIESVESNAVKAYHSLHNTWAMGEGAPAGFAHLIVKLMSGRPLEVRQKVSDRLFTALKESFQASLEHEEVLLTLEIIEIASETYRRTVRQ